MGRRRSEVFGSSAKFGLTTEPIIKANGGAGTLRPWSAGSRSIEETGTRRR